MMNCSECQKPMRWVADEDYTETCFYSFYECHECNIEVFKYWGDRDE
jgi:hypothetical protein